MVVFTFQDLGPINVIHVPCVCFAGERTKKYCSSLSLWTSSAAGTESINLKQQQKVHVLYFPECNFLRWGLLKKGVYLTCWSLINLNEQHHHDKWFGWTTRWRNVILDDSKYFFALKQQPQKRKTTTMLIMNKLPHS